MGFFFDSYISKKVREQFATIESKDRFMKVTFKGVIAIFLSAFVLVSTHAQESTNLPFVLSGVIQLNANSSTIRVVQAVVLSTDEKKAVEVFKTSAANQYPDYTIVDVL